MPAPAPPTNEAITSEFPTVHFVTLSSRLLDLVVRYFHLDTDVANWKCTPTLSGASKCGLMAGTRGDGDTTLNPLDVFKCKVSPPENQTCSVENDDRQFAADLYNSYYSILYRKALSILKKEDLAEDAVQDTMVKVICHLDKIREIPKREIPFYLVAITQTTCIDRYRKIQKEKQACVMGYEDDWSKSLSDQKNPEKVFIHTDQIKLLTRCLKELPQREIDLLYYFYTMELSGKEIARLMGMTENAVRMALTRARRKVLLAYRKKGGDDHE